MDLPQGEERTALRNQMMQYITKYNRYQCETQPVLELELAQA